MHVQHILALKGRDVVTIDAAATLEGAARTLATQKIGAVLITGDGTGPVAGILSERDIVHALAEHGAAALGLTVAHAMTRDVSTCASTDTVDAVMEVMTTGRFRHLPVIDDGQLAGMISIGDVVKHRISEIEAEKEALREFIAS